MNAIRMAFDYLNSKPVIGMASGFSSGLILTIQGFLTDETLLKLVAGLGVYLGAMVAGLTFLLKCIEISQKWRAKRNDKIN